VRAWTAPPSRDLRRGVAREDARLFRPLEAPSSDEDSASNGLDSLDQGSRSPGGTTSRSARHGFYDRISSRAALLTNSITMDSSAA